MQTNATRRATASLALLSALFMFSISALAQCPINASQTEGPYYRTPNPETNNLRIAGDGPLLTLTGQVVDTSCNPIPYSWVAIWHTDPAGVYDNVAPFDRYRGWFFTDANGEFTLYTIVPGLYPGRTRHTHVKVDAPHTNVLTTQLYFPGEPLNSSDPLYNAALELDDYVQEPDGSFSGTFRFSLATAGGCVAPSVTADPTSLSRAVGESAIFSITATGGAPMTFQWRRNGVALQNGNGISGVSTSTLTIASVSCANAGAYECAALSACGTDTSAPATLTVTGCCPGNINGDAQVDLADLTILLAHFGTAEGATPADGDLDRDQDVDLSDLTTLLANFGSICP